MLLNMQVQLSAGCSNLSSKRKRKNGECCNRAGTKAYKPAMRCEEPGNKTASLARMMRSY